MKRSSLRKDIQALRGIAVLLVLLFHAKIGGLAAGYLGVDIFFVLSGYLITGLVSRRLDEDRFSFSEFYLNRAKRLLPAAYIVYASTAIAAYWLLTDSEFDRLLKTLWGGLTFTANITLWMDTNYFSPGAKFNALLHVWSLSIEEQFYFLLPLALFLSPQQYRLTLIVFGGVISLVLCLYIAPISPVATFYLLPTRAWELALGGALALVEARRRRTPRPVTGGEIGRIGFWLGVGALAIIILTPAFAPGALLGSQHPGIDAILVCAATGLLLVRRSPLLVTGAVASGLSRLGDISYSLYLVHWPLFAFATNAYLGTVPPIETRLGLLATSLVLAYLLHCFVEQPIRNHSYSELSPRPVFTALVATLLVVIVASGVRMIRSLVVVNLPARTANFGLSPRCEFKRRFVPLSECATQKKSDTLLWGDSFAMHLASGLAEQNSVGLIQATKSMCGPIMGIAPYLPLAGALERWARECIEFNRSVITHLEEMKDIKRVILSSPFNQFVKERGVGVIEKNGIVLVSAIDYRLVVQKFRATIDKIQALGKKVTIVGPTPTGGFDVGLCYERRAVELVTLGPNRTCDISSSYSRALRARQIKLLREVSALTGARFIDLAYYLCDKETCRTAVDGIPLYRDAGHFSEIGSRKVMAMPGLAAAILQSVK